MRYVLHCCKQIDPSIPIECTVTMYSDGSITRKYGDLDEIEVNLSKDSRDKIDSIGYKPKFFNILLRNLCSTELLNYFHNQSYQGSRSILLM